MSVSRVLFGVVLVSAAAACAEPAGGRPKVDPLAARTIAARAVPGGHVESAEQLQEENGVLVYSFDIKVEGQSGVEEIHVNANTGEIVSQVHETEEEEDDEGGDEVGNADTR